MNDHILRKEIPHYKDKISRLKSQLLDILNSHERRVLLDKQIDELIRNLKKTGDLLDYALELDDIVEFKNDIVSYFDYINSVDKILNG